MASTTISASVLRDDKVDKLIDEVEARPPLYKKSLKEYSDIILKKKLWEEVCEAVVDNWGTLQTKEKANEGTNIKKRWDSLRTCFARELRAQTNTKSGQAASKRRKYVYFDRLLFLLPEVEQRQTVCNIGPAANNDACNEVTVDIDEQDDVTVQDIEDIEEDNENRGGCQKISGKKPVKKATYEEQLLHVLRTKQNEVNDEETNFALSLVPTLKTLPEANKIQCRIEILNVLQRFKYGNTGFYPTAGQYPPSFPTNQQFASDQINQNFRNHYQNTSAFPPSFQSYENLTGLPTFSSEPTNSRVLTTLQPVQRSNQPIPPDNAKYPQVSSCTSGSNQSVTSYFSSYGEKGSGEGADDNSTF
ncbi:transcription factor Adf-1-like [Macrosteles quadrilineatus]|uniref:transcription factor Adf-1-like n=1 Tax=Macrosteles quadrilineatus TaxID=74068 RepID=UPI0023E29A0F|nr:transcription factor Adf-1-like [Macrosteles quadrilineatus]